MTTSISLTTHPFDTLLDAAPWVAQRVATFRFDLVNGLTDQPLGELHPLSTATPAIDHNTGQTIKRRLSGLALDRSDTAEINPLTDRVIVAMLLAGRSWPLGRYMFTDHIRALSTGGAQSGGALVDEMYIVDQQLTETFAPTNPGDTAEVAVRELLDSLVDPSAQSLPLARQPVIEQSGYPAIGAWAAGTTRGQVLSALTTQGDYFPPWFDNRGAFHMIRSFEPADRVPDFDLDRSGAVIANTITQSSDVLAAPNRFVVISNSGDGLDAPVVGTYDVPPTAPHSIQSRGFVLADVRTLQLVDIRQAIAAARNLGLRQTVFDRADLATFPDPRHDSYDVIRWNGDLWLELAWSLPLVEGSQMSHSLRKAYRTVSGEAVGGVAGP